MRNAGLKNSNYCMASVAPPLYVTCKILYDCIGILVHCTVYNGVEELLRTFVGILARGAMV